jgi:hypothetical protein
MGIARFGSSPHPMENYALQDPEQPDFFRNIVPAPTLDIGNDGSIVEVRMPEVVQFRDRHGLIKPICPFFEVWAQFEQDGPFQPLTLDHLTQLGLRPSHVKWRATATNSKAWRRTGEPKDTVTASIDRFSDHRSHELRGTSPNFKPRKFISFGQVRYIKPTAGPVTSVIRARFTPGKGLVFGPRKGDPFTHDDVYWSHAMGGPKSANWDRYYVDDEDNNKMPATAPGDIFQGWMMGLANSFEEWGKLSAGYFDDTCDGIIEVTIVHKRTRHTAYARFASAVPDFAPDSLPVRSIADDLEQLVLGPCIKAPRNITEKKFKAKLIDILRRSFDTVRQMNTVSANGTPFESEPLEDGEKRNWQSMSMRLATNNDAKYTPVFPADDTLHTDSHKQMFSYWSAFQMHKHQLIKAMHNGRTTAFYIMRMPEDAADVWPSSRMQMPAFMRGSEGLELCLTRRQLSVLAVAAGEKPEVVLSRAAANAARVAAGRARPAHGGPMPAAAPAASARGRRGRVGTR